MKNIQRIFIPGDRWMYLKLYTGIKTADKILIKKLSYIISILQRKHFIEKWFFIRYNDPDFHIRIRFLVKDTNSIGELLQIIFKETNHLIKSREIWKIQIDTYSRELERYGFSLIEESESVFFIDSESTLSILKQLDRFKNENYRWMIALKMVDRFLSDFSISLCDKHKLLGSIAESFKIEFGFNKFNLKQFNYKYRQYKKNIEFALKENNTEPSFIILNKIIKKRSDRLMPLATIIIQKNATSEDRIAIEDLLLHYIHMSINRLFRSKSRLHELIVYDFLFRYYSSEVAKIKYSVSK